MRKITKCAAPLHLYNHRSNYRRRLFLADANIGRKVYVCTNLCNDCPINRGPDQWEQSNFPITSSPSALYRNEWQLRADLKWDSIDKREISKLATGIREPVFHVHALSRGTRCDFKKVKFSLVLTVITSSAEIDLYDTILNKYSALIPLDINLEVGVDVSNDINGN